MKSKPKDSKRSQLSPADRVERVSRVPHLLPDEERTAQQLMLEVAKHIKFDAYIFGVGHRTSDGQVEVDRALCNNVPREFINEYSTVAAVDTVAKLLICNGTNALTGSALDYPSVSHAAGKVGRLLRKHNVAHLMPVAISTIYGFVWVTVYRLAEAPELRQLDGLPAGERAACLQALRAKLPAAFSAEEAEFARYFICGRLYEWQMNSQNARDLVHLDVDRYRMLHLTSRELDVALRLARGWTLDRIRQDLGLSPAFISRLTGSVKKRLQDERILLSSAAASQDSVDSTKADYSQIADRLLGRLHAVSNSNRTSRET